jgi:Mrp family chromosome partitioning ATPase
VLRTPSELDAALVALTPNLHLLPSSSDDAAAALLSSDRLGRVLEALRERADIVVIDTPAIDETADAYDIAARADRVLVCVAPGRTDREALERLVSQLERVGSGRIGLVAVDRRPANGGLNGHERRVASSPPMPADLEHDLPVEVVGDSTRRA